MRDKKIFMACPISKYLTDDGIDKEFEIFIKEVYEFCKSLCSKTFMALDREEYGKKKMYGSDCTVDDFEEIKDTDLLIAFPEDSMGVSVELGWASALGIDTIVFVDQKYKQSELVKSINSVVNGKAYTIDTSSGFLNQMDIIKENIRNYVEQYI